MAELASILHWPDNVWMGVTVESYREVFRIEALQSVKAAVRFISMEPLLTPISEFPTENIDWVIVGGESGPRARPMDKRWVIEIRNRCVAAGIPFFFKQWGGKNKKKNGRLLEGKYYNEYPLIHEDVLQYAPTT